MNKSSQATFTRVKFSSLKVIIAVLSVLIFSIVVEGFVLKEVPEGYKAAGVSDDDKPSEEVYKNIQVLKGTPASELMSLMHFMRASLNVKCNFCHVHDEKTNTWDFVTDTLEGKKVTREMIEMVKDINTRHFSGRTSVTCFTCHNGNEHPQRTPMLPQHIPVEQTEHHDENLPEVRTIIDNYYKAIGVTGIDGIKTRYSTGSSALYDGKSFPIEIYQQAPDKFLSILTAPDGSKVYRGYDGKQGWTMNSEGTQPVEGASLTTLKDFADIYSGVDLSRYSDTRVIGTDTANGSNCYVVWGVISDRKSARLYFDINTGLLKRKTIYTKTVIGSVPVRTEYSNYSQAGDVKAAYRMGYSFLDPWAEISRDFTSVKYNIPMDTVNFSMPVK